jgi:hypothetical protein
MQKQKQNLALTFQIHSNATNNHNTFERYEQLHSLMMYILSSKGKRVKELLVAIC